MISYQLCNLNTNLSQFKKYSYITFKAKQYSVLWKFWIDSINLQRNSKQIFLTCAQFQSCSIVNLNFIELQIVFIKIDLPILLVGHEKWYPWIVDTLDPTISGLTSRMAYKVSFITAIQII